MATRKPAYEYDEDKPVEQKSLSTVANEPGEPLEEKPEPGVKYRGAEVPAGSAASGVLSPSEKQNDRDLAKEKKEAEEAMKTAAQHKYRGEQ